MHKSNKDILEEVKPEIERLLAKINFALQDNSGFFENSCSDSSFASVKRSALDVKRELTKITQSSKYRYGKLKGHVNTAWD